MNSISYRKGYKYQTVKDYKTTTRIRPAQLIQTEWVTLTMDGPDTSERATPNPFIDYRLDVEFTGPSGQVYIVPGFFAADGNAAITGADSGDKWRVHFAPDEDGEWSYKVSFQSGQGVAVADDPSGDSVAPFDGLSGVIAISSTDKSGRDLRGKGPEHP